jgi:mono/diheme cytochrome c family protein
VRRFAVPLAAAALLTGCGGAVASSERADKTRGKELFQQKCGACHVLADAGTQGDVGPNLDNAFKFAENQGLEESTFFEVTLEQMQIPGPPMPDYDEKGSKDYLPEQDRVSIAAYVAEAAGSPAQQAIGPNEKDPLALYTGSGCGSCHALAAAESTGTVGPNLDDSDVSLDEAVTQITEGGGGMPAYEGRLTDEQIRILAQYVVGGGG